MTVHNTRPGWPDGQDRLRPGDATLVAACARAVEADLRAAGVPVPVRTVWNGVDFAAHADSPSLRARARAFRRRLGLAAGDFVLLALANPRPQKRLDLLPAILAATRRRLRGDGWPHGVHLLLGGTLVRLVTFILNMKLFVPGGSATATQSIASEAGANPWSDCSG